VTSAEATRSQRGRGCQQHITVEPRDVKGQKSKRLGTLSPSRSLGFFVESCDAAHARRQHNSSRCIILAGSFAYKRPAQRSLRKYIPKRR
jgi:hypothetical protein